MNRALFMFCFFSLTLPLMMMAGYRLDEKGVVKSGDEVETQRAPDSKPGRESFYKDVQSRSSEGNVLKNLSERYQIDTERLKYFRSLHYGYEELVPALVIAREAQVEVGRVLNARLEGLSWKQIAKSLQVELKPLNEEVVTVLKPIRKVLPKSVIEEKPNFVKQ